MKPINFFMLIAFVACATYAGARDKWQEIHGTETNGLEPILIISHYDNDWFYEIDYHSRTAVSNNVWLNITNRTGSKLELWLKNGEKMQLKDESAIAAMSLPSQTSVSNIMSGVGHSSRGRLWLRFPLGYTPETDAGQSAASYNYSLGKAFAASFTNEVSLHLTPLLYYISTNSESASLIEFSQFRLRLLPNGEIIPE
jgi:hypothetical protein